MREIDFTFGDANPLTGRPFAQSRFRDLPGYAADAVTDMMQLKPGEWDALVEDGEAYEVTGGHAYAILPGATLTRRPRKRDTPLVVGGWPL